MSFSWGGAKCTETFSYSMYSILFPFRNHTGLFKTNVTDTFDCTSCAGYGNYQLQSCCANLGSTQTSCLDCGTCSRGYAADTFPYGYSSHSFLCLLYFFFFFFYYCCTRVFSKFCKWLCPNRLHSQFSHLVHFSSIPHMHACVNIEHLCLLLRMHSSSSSTHEIFIG